ncbi:MAG TPA: aldo/keto reductase [Bryobacteraceae bacterium]|nr:aldo/keto reductase [Bryobacteraceae bacterium]
MPQSTTIRRRAFLRNAVASAVAVPLASGQQSSGPATQAGIGANESQLPKTSSPGDLKGEMLYRPLGRTGETVSAIGLGGSHIAKPTLTEAETIRLIHAAIDRGITFMDNSWDYNEGRSERLMGKALSENHSRNKVFLMTKIDGRAKGVAAEQIDSSLKRLQTDHVDLLQFHEILRYDDPDRIFSEGCALEAVLEAKKAGKFKFIGFTGHKDPHVHLYMLEVAAKHSFRFDTVQMPLNVMDAHFRSFTHLVVPRLTAAGIGVLGMKPFGGGDGIILKSNTVKPVECLHYALNLPTSVVITGVDKQQVLDQAFEAAKAFRLMDEQQTASLLSKTEQAAKNGQYELFKTTAHFDTTARHPRLAGVRQPGRTEAGPRTPRLIF